MHPPHTCYDRKSAARTGSKARRSPLTLSPAITHTVMRSGGDRRLRSTSGSPSRTQLQRALPHKLHTHSVRRAPWHTHTQWPISRGGERHRGPQHGRTAHARRAPPQRRHGGSPRDPHAQPNYMAHPAPHTSTGEAVCGPVALPFPRDRNVDACAVRSWRANRPCLTSPSCAASCAPHAPHPHRRGSASCLLQWAAR